MQTDQPGLLTDEIQATASVEQFAKSLCEFSRRIGFKQPRSTFGQPFFCEARGRVTRRYEYLHLRAESANVLGELVTGHPARHDHVRKHKGNLRVVCEELKGFGACLGLDDPITGV